MGFNPSTVSYQNGVNSASYPTLSAAIADVPSGGTLVLGRTWTLSGDLSIPSGISQIVPAGGKIVLNGHNLTFNLQFINQGALQWLDVSGGGSLLGDINNSTMYPEWAGATGYNSVPANATATRVALNALEAFDCQSASPGRYLQFAPGSYAVDQPISTPGSYPGKGTRWIGCSDSTTIYSTINTQVRIVTGQSAGSLNDVFMKNLQLGGLTAGSTTAAIEIRDWCGFEYEDISFFRCAYGVRVRSYGTGGFSENVKGRRNRYESSITSACILADTVSGTGSIRGFSETDFLYSRGANTDALTFIQIGNGADGTFLYNGTLKGVITNNFGTNNTLIVANCESSTIASFKDTALDLEASGSGNKIKLADTNTVLMGGGFASNCGWGIDFGTALCGCSFTNVSGTINVMQGWQRFSESCTGNGTQTISQQVFLGSYRTRFLIDLGGNFTAFVDAEVYVDDIGTNHEVNVLTLKVPYNGLGLTFTSSNIGVNSSGQLTWQANLGANSGTASGIQFVTGGFQ